MAAYSLGESIRNGQYAAAGLQVAMMLIGPKLQKKLAEISKPPLAQSENPTGQTQPNDGTTASETKSTEPTDQQKIDQGVDALKQTEWAKTPRGQQIVKALETSNEKGNIGFGKLEEGVRAQFDPKTDKITIGEGTSIEDVPGRLAHEGSHLVQDIQGQKYGLISEVEAFANGFAVDYERGRPDAYMPTWQQIESRYGF